MPEGHRAQPAGLEAQAKAKGAFVRERSVRCRAEPVRGGTFSLPPVQEPSDPLLQVQPIREAIKDMMMSFMIDPPRGPPCWLLLAGCWLLRSGCWLPGDRLPVARNPEAVRPLPAIRTPARERRNEGGCSAAERELCGA